MLPFFDAHVKNAKTDNLRYPKSDKATSMPEESTRSSIGPSTSTVLAWQPSYHASSEGTASLLASTTATPPVTDIGALPMLPAWEGRAEDNTAHLADSISHATVMDVGGWGSVDGAMPFLTPLEEDYFQDFLNTILVDDVQSTNPTPLAIEGLGISSMTGVARVDGVASGKEVADENGMTSADGVTSGNRMETRTTSNDTRATSSPMALPPTQGLGHIQSTWPNVPTSHLANVSPNLGSVTAQPLAPPSLTHVHGTTGHVAVPQIAPHTPCSQGPFARTPAVPESSCLQVASLTALSPSFHGMALPMPLVPRSHGESGVGVGNGLWTSPVPWAAAGCHGGWQGEAMAGRSTGSVAPGATTSPGMLMMEGLVSPGDAAWVTGMEHGTSQETGDGTWTTRTVHTTTQKSSSGTRSTRSGQGTSPSSVLPWTGGKRKGSEVARATPKQRAAKRAKTNLYTYASEKDTASHGNSLTHEEKRLNHIASEQKRRETIRNWFNELTRLVQTHYKYPNEEVPTKGRKTRDRGGHQQSKSRVLFRGRAMVTCGKKCRHECVLVCVAVGLVKQLEEENRLMRERLMTLCPDKYQNHFISMSKSLTPLSPSK